MIKLETLVGWGNFLTIVVWGTNLILWALRSKEPSLDAGREMAMEEKSGGRRPGESEGAGRDQGPL